MPLELDPHETKEIVASLQRYFEKELASELSDLRAKLLLEYILQEIAPFAYNRGVKDAETFVRTKLDDLTGTCFEDGLTYWLKKKRVRG
jgi:uncharacterized protein (DUF2164 family)